MADREFDCQCRVAVPFNQYHLIVLCRLKHSFVLFGPFCIAIVTLLFGTTTHGALALMYSTLYGIIEQWKVICLQTILQKNARMDALPHVFSVQGVISSVTFGISALLMSFIADVYGIRFSFYLSVCCFLISGWISYRQRKIWSFDTGLTQKSGNASI